MLANVLCWRAACFRRGGTIPPRLALGGNGKGGESNSLLPQANLGEKRASFQAQADSSFWIQTPAIS